MKKLLIVAVFLAEFTVAFAGNPIIVIRCRVTGEFRDAATVSVADPQDAECYNGELNITVDDPACDNPDPAADVIKLILTRADGSPWIPNDDAITIDDLRNCNLINNTNSVLTILDDAAGDRGAFVADANGLIEIEFTRDPTQDTEIVLRNAFATDDAAPGADPQIIFIPACPAVEAVVPTMGEWSIIALSFMFLIFGIIAIRQRTATLTPVKERVK